MKSMRTTCRCGFAVLLALAFGSLPVAAADGAVQACQAKSLGPSAALVEAEAYIDFSDLLWLSGGRSSGSGTSTAVNVSPCATSKVVCESHYCPGCPCCKDVQGTACATQNEKQCIMPDNCVYNCECIGGKWDCGYVPDEGR